MSDSKQSEPPPSDRRAGERHLACFPAYVERPDDKPRTTMIYELSVTGALLLVRTELAVGDPVKLQLFISEDPKEARAARGRVVRVEPLGDDAVGLWSRRVAVQFDEPLTIYEAEIQALKERQSRLGAL
jgi:hypothetical protein